MPYDSMQQIDIAHFVHPLDDVLVPNKGEPAHLLSRAETR